MPPIYLVRFPKGQSGYASFYGISFHGPPVLNLKPNNVYEWDYCSKMFSPSEFHTIFRGLQLRPGEGPVVFHADAWAEAYTPISPKPDLSPL